MGLITAETVFDSGKISSRASSRKSVKEIVKASFELSKLQYLVLSEIVGVSLFMSNEMMLKW